MYQNAGFLYKRGTTTIHCWKWKDETFLERFLVRKVQSLTAHIKPNALLSKIGKYGKEISVVACFRRSKKRRNVAA